MSICGYSVFTYILKWFLIIDMVGKNFSKGQDVGENLVNLTNKLKIGKMNKVICRCLRDFNDGSDNEQQLI